MNKNSKGFAHWFTLILASGVIVFIGFTLTRNLRFNPQPSRQPTPTPDPTADWKGYSFKVIGLTLKAPSDLSVTSDEPNPGHDFTLFIQNPSYGPNKKFYQLYLTTQFDFKYTKEELGNRKEDLIPSSIKDITIDGFPAVQGQVKGERDRYVTYILKGNQLFSIFTADPVPENKKLTNQILSTFKFLDQESVEGRVCGGPVLTPCPAGYTCQ